MNIIRRFYYSYKINSLANSLKKEASKKNKSDEKIQKIINNLDLFVNSQKMNYFSTDRIIKFYNVKVAVLSKNSHLNKNAKFEAVAKKVHALITDRTPEQLKFSSSSHAGVHSTGSGDRPLSPPPPPPLPGTGNSIPANGNVPPPPPPLSGKAGKPLPRIPQKSADPQFTGIAEWIPSVAAALNSPKRKKAFLESLKKQLNEWTPEQKQEVINLFNENTLRYLSHQEQAEIRRLLEGGLSVETLIKMGEYQLQAILNKAQVAKEKIELVDGFNEELVTSNNLLEQQRALLEAFKEAQENEESKISVKYLSKDGLVSIEYYSSEKELAKNKLSLNLSITKAIAWINENIEEVELEIQDLTEKLEKAQKEAKTILAQLGKGIKKENITKLSDELARIKADLSQLSSANANSSSPSNSKAKKEQLNKKNDNTLDTAIQALLRTNPRGLLLKVLP